MSDSGHAKHGEVVRCRHGDAGKIRKIRWLWLGRGGPGGTLGGVWGSRWIWKGGLVWVQSR